MLKIFIHLFFYLFSTRSGLIYITNLMFKVMELEGQAEHLVCMEPGKQGDLVAKKVKVK